jgi:DNA-binding transcriptional LysR family regulator
LSHSLNHIEVFVRVVQTRSFTRAARTLSLSKATVSNHVSALERHLGAPLLTRTTRSVNLTEAGAAFYARCRSILLEVETAEAEVSRTMATPTGTLRIGATSALAELLAMAGLAGFLEDYPRIDIDLSLDDGTADPVEKGWDLALRLSPGVPAGPKVERLGSCPSLLCAAPAYCEHHGLPSDPGDLGRHRCLVEAGRADQQTWVLDGPEGTEGIKVPVRLRVSGGGALRSALLGGLGVGLVPAVLVVEDLRAGRLVRLLASYTGAPQTLYAICAHEGRLAPKVRVFLDFLRARMARLSSGAAKAGGRRAKTGDRLPPPGSGPNP